MKPEVRCRVIRKRRMSGNSSVPEAPKRMIAGARRNDAVASQSACAFYAGMTCRADRTAVSQSQRAEGTGVTAAHAGEECEAAERRCGMHPPSSGTSSFHINAENVNAGGRTSFARPYRTMRCRIVQTENVSAFCVRHPAKPADAKEHSGIGKKEEFHLHRCF